MTTALHSVVVDDTQPAAEATDPGPTEHIHAWSEKDDATEVVTYVPRHSWKLPLLCAALATGAVVGGAIFAWPHHHVPTPVPTTTHQVPAVPTQALSPDAVFLKNLHDAGFPVYDQMSAITAGRYACQEIKEGHLPIAQVEKEFIASTNGYFTPTQGFEFIGAALNAYCPQG